jgi:hypothetical protein
MKVVMVIGLALCAVSSASAQRRFCIDEADVERVEVVKGPRAIQQYGAKAGEGVIIITTRIPPGIGPTFSCGPGQGSGDDPFARLLYSPELVMQNQQAIGLTEQQRGNIQELIKMVQSKFVDTQFKMSGEMERLKLLIEATSPDEQKVLEQIDRVLQLEREAKRSQLSLMIGIKNQLSEQQELLLSKLRGDDSGQPVSPGRGRGSKPE